MAEELARQQPCQARRYRALGDHESPLPQSVDTAYGGRSTPANCSIAQVECPQFHALYGGRLEFHTVMISRWLLAYTPDDRNGPLGPSGPSPAVWKQ
jgi:hypothetical protein